MALSSAPESQSISLEQLRASRGVRPLRPEEEGCAIEHLPDGVYGFTYSPGPSAIPVFAKRDYHSFEIHKSADGNTYAIGFVTTEEAAKLEAMEQGAAIRLFPGPWEGAQCLVSVPTSRIVSPRRGLPREAGNPFPFSIG